LFGFLLALPFTMRFSHLEAWQRGLYLGIVMLSSASIVLLVAPVAYHRLLFRRHQLGSLLRAANLMSIGGMISVALAVIGAVLLVTSYVQPGWTAVLLTALAACMFGGLWFVLPMVRRESSKAGNDSQ
jgi:uncharacterized membrane protein